MSAIDTRVVEAKFNNSQFGKGVADTISALGRLKGALKLDGASKGIQDVSKAAAQFDATPMEQGASRIGGQFTAMQAVAFGALASVGAKAVQVGTQIANSLSLAPVMQGFQEYETNMNSIQTILANTKAAGTGLPEVNAALDEMNHYSDETIYNFSEMARNVGTFTAAGVDLDTATGSIKGIANLAALSGSNSQQAAGAMYQLSQEIAAGKVTLMGWNSVVNAGMGGTIFQRALAETAVAMGKIDSSALKLEGDMKNVVINGKAFRDSISAEGGQESWLSSDVLTATLQQFTGDLSDAELAAQGFSAAQIEAIKDQANTAVNAATEVKTLTGLMDTLKEGVASGWSSTFRILVGDFEEAKSLFTGISGAVGDWLGSMSKARNELLSGWKEMGGRTVLIEGLQEALSAILAPLSRIGDAFRQIFPRTSVQNLYDMTVAFRDFALSIQPSRETLDNIRRTFAGLFAVLGIGWEVIKAGASFIADLIGQFSGGAGSILSFTGGIGDFLVSLHTAIKEGEGLTKFFEGLSKILSYPIAAIKSFTNILGAMFGGLSTEGAGDAISGLTEDLAPLGRVGEIIAGVWERIVGIFDNVVEAFNPLADRLGEFFSNLGSMIADGVGDINVDTIMTGLQTALGAGFVLVLKRIADTISNFSIFGGGGEGLLESAQEALQGLTGTLEAMQANLKANALLKIAAAIGIMTIALIALSTIDSAKLATALAAMTAMFVQLGAALTVFSTIGTPAQAVKLIATSAALILMATAITILSRAVERLANLDNEGLRDGLIAVAVLITVLARAADKLNGQSGAMVRTGVMLIFLATAVKILASAVKDMSELDLEELAKGLAGVGGLLGALILFTKLAKLDKVGVKSGLGLILLGAGMKVLASAVKDFADMSWEELGKGLGGVAGGLFAIAGAMRLMPKSSLLNAAAILIVAASLKMIADAIESMEDMRWQDMVQGVGSLAGALIGIAAALKMLPKGAIFSAAAIFVVAASLGMIVDAIKGLGDMSWQELATGLIGLSLALRIIAGAMNSMFAALPGAAALLVVAAALRVLFPVIQAFSEMTWEELLKGLVGLAGVFLVLGVAGLVLAPIVPVILLLGAAILLLGAGVIMAGAGVLMFSLALTALAAAGAAGTAAIVAIVSGLVGLIPMVMEQIGLGIVAFANVIATSGPAILGAISAVLGAFLQAIIDNTPKVAETFLTLLFTLLRTIELAIPRLVTAGFNILLGFLRGIRDNIGRIVTVAGEIIINFLNALAGQLPGIIQAGINLVISFVNGLAEGIRNNSAAMGEAGGNLATAMVEGMINGLGGMAGKLIEEARKLAQRAWEAAKDWLGIESPSKKFIELGKYSSEGFAIGLSGNKDKIRGAVKDMMGHLDEGIKSSRETIKKYQETYDDIMDKRKETLYQRAGAYHALAQARAREVGSDAKTEAARSAEIKRESEARSKAIVSAVERIRKLDRAYEDQEESLRKLGKKNHEALTEHHRLTVARNALSKEMVNERKQLESLADQYDIYSEKLDDANQKLSDAKKVRDDYNTSLRSQYSDLPDISEDTKLADYVRDLETQIVDTEKFTIAIGELRKRGLNDTMYKELLAKGPEAMPFIQEVLAGGTNKVQQLNTLGSALDRSAKTLASRASSALYQAGVDAAQGLVNGLKSKRAQIDAEMKRISDWMVWSIQRHLGIKSPSRVFAEIGAYSAEGLVKGLDESSALISKSAEGTGQTVIDSMRKSISGLSDLISGDMDLNPVVTPVLDLSTVKKDSALIGSLLDAQALSIDSSYSKAKDASAGYTANQKALSESRSVEPIAPIQFVQHNNSPKALSSAQIYRQTNNQLSVARGALASNAN